MRGEDNVRTEMTGGQIAINSIISALGFCSDMEVPFPPYRVDIYIREIHCAVEFDGHHTFKSKDKKRDEYLLSTYNLPVLRITKIYPRKEVVDKLSDFFKECAKRKFDKETERN